MPEKEVNIYCPSSRNWFRDWSKHQHNSMWNFIIWLPLLTLWVYDCQCLYLDLWGQVYFVVLYENDIHASNALSLLKETKHLYGEFLDEGSRWSVFCFWDKICHDRSRRLYEKLFPKLIKVKVVGLVKINFQQWNTCIDSKL